MLHLNSMKSSAEIVVSLGSAHHDLHLMKPKEQTLRPEGFCVQSITYTVALPLLACSLIALMIFNHRINIYTYILDTKSQRLHSRKRTDRCMH